VATNTQWAAATPDQVWAVLADPFRYPDWVLGVETLRDADPDWPRPGTCLHYLTRVARWRLEDRTCVVDAEPGRALTLLARGGRVGAARVELRLRPERDGTLITMDEVPHLQGAFRHAAPLLDPWLWVRNIASLRRLAAVSAGTAPG
jgi:hypothetical protein